MTLVDPRHETGHDVEREAVFFAVLRERVRPAADIGAEQDAWRRMQEADNLISEWLDEAEEEGACIIERARGEAARVRAEAEATVRSLQADVLALQGRLSELATHAGSLLLAGVERQEPPAVAPAPPMEPIEPEVVTLGTRPRGRVRRLLRRG